MESTFSKVVSLIADPVRSTVLWTLLDGRAYTAGELAIAAEVSQQNMSIHLKKLTDAHILNALKQGRHRYYQFARDDFAYAVENLANLIPHEKVVADGQIAGIKYCRTCYDHLAGKIAVQITHRLVELAILIDDKDSKSFDFN
jgi:DNA-binding transcriptional ArsR family regulator